MGIATLPVLEDGTDCSGVAEWKALTCAIDVSENAAHDLGVTPLSEFDSTLPEDLAQGEELEEMRAEILDHDDVLPVRQWFSADDGLRTAAHLFSFVRQLDLWPEEEKDSLVGVLEGFEQAMTTAKRRGVRFYLQVFL